MNTSQGLIKTSSRWLRASHSESIHRRELERDIWIQPQPRDHDDTGSHFTGHFAVNPAARRGQPDCVLCRALWTVLLLHYLKHKYRVVTWHCVLLLNIAAHHSRKMLHDPHCRGTGGNLDQVVNFQNYKTAFLPSPHPIIPWWPRPASRYQLPTQQTSYFYHHSDGNEMIEIRK